MVIERHVYFYFEGPLTVLLFERHGYSIILKMRHPVSGLSLVVCVCVCVCNLTQAQLAVLKTCEGLVKAEFRCFHTAQRAPAHPHRSHHPEPGKLAGEHRCLLLYTVQPKPLSSETCL